ncbi:hypothetical protein [Autumnicola psychrophila]|uniref:Glycosyltransferase RgtA/B/C/D-like domain-containing protein n=1 Tax=Autumnicola psychrophila TaxID=3075592 RepID=A0ABU3DT13_9FLAO|nr:hypothetical protein [Zunongwangia sp. F225]MDT0686852.1 hypothetical protein [Zunongwangia sp. F225]
MKIKRFPHFVRDHNLNLIATLLFFFFIFYLLFIYEIGLADSADFSRVIDRLGLGRPFSDASQNFFNYFNLEYPIISDQSIPLDFSQLIGSLALFLNKIFYSQTNFSIYFLSGIYLLLYTSGYFLLLRNTTHYFKKKGARVGFMLFAGLLFSDILFISYFNSFYQESIFLISLLFVLALSLARKLNYNFLFIALLVLSLSKMQNLVFILLPIGLVAHRWQKLNRTLLLISFLVFSSMIFLQLKTQQKTNEANIYEAVFLGVLLKADLESQKKLLSDFNLNDLNYLKNVGRGYWRQGNELYDYGLAEDFYGRISNFTVLQMYFENPKLFFKTGLEGLKVLAVSSAQPEHLGNLSREDSVDGKKIRVLSLLGKILHLILWPIYILISIFYVAFIKSENAENKLMFHLLYYIPLVFCANFISGGINDFIKHNLSLYFMICCLLLIFYISLNNKLKKDEIVHS